MKMRREKSREEKRREEKRSFVGHGVALGLKAVALSQVEETWLDENPFIRRSSIFEIHARESCKFICIQIAKLNVIQQFHVNASHCVLPLLLLMLLLLL